MLVDTQKIDELPLSTKVELKEVVMSALTKNKAEFVAPAWHDDVLEKRAHEVPEPDAWNTFDQVRTTLKTCPSRSHSHALRKKIRFSPKTFT